MFLTVAADSNIFEAFVSFVQGFGNFLDNITSFIFHFYHDLVYYISLLIKAHASLPQYFAFLPSTVISILLTTFSLVIVFQVLGRQ